MRSDVTLTVEIAQQYGASGFSAGMTCASCDVMM
jgi:hypothetical protein